MKLSYLMLNDYIDTGDKIIVGVSGGADSMCLLDLILKFSKEKEFDFYAVHVNHGIRGEEAKRDQEFVEKFCLENKINFKSFKVDAKISAKKENKTLEQAARDLRYGAIYCFKDEIKANKVFVAHHMIDQAETVLMHLARGSSLSGAKGMSDKGPLYRPLLGCTRKQILEYNARNGVKYVEDSTNNDSSYARNYVRKEVLPKIEKVYPNFVKAICQFADKCKVDDDFIESMMPDDLLKVEQKGIKLLTEAQKLHPALSLRLIKRTFECLGVFADIENKHLVKVLELFDKRNGSKLDLPHGLKAYKEYEGVFVINRSEKQEDVQLPFKLESQTFEGFGVVNVSKLENLKNLTFEKGIHYIDLDKIPQNAVWRTIKTGDTFKKFGGGTKKLCDYFTDKKIAKRKRDSIPVLASDNTILIVAGYDISEHVKVTNQTIAVAKITYQVKQ